VFTEMKKRKNKQLTGNFEAQISFKAK